MKKSGFTLIEMIIVLALTVIIIGIASSIFTNGNRIFSDSDAKSTLQIQAQTIQEEISKVGMEAIGIESITDIDGHQTTGSAVKPIVNADYGDLYLTDINGKRIQNDENNENAWLQVSEVIVESYNEAENTITPSTIITYDKFSKKLSTVKDEELREFQGEVESVRIKPINITKSDGTFWNTNSIVVSVMLHRKSGFADVTYPVLITVKFRNNFMR